jgi:hypothetical protein
LIAAINRSVMTAFLRRGSDLITAIARWDTENRIVSEVSLF